MLDVILILLAILGLPVFFIFCCPCINSPWSCAACCFWAGPRLRAPVP